MKSIFNEQTLWLGIFKNGRIEWYKDKVKHRVGGPAVIYSDGYKEWYSNGKLYHVETPNGKCYDYKNELFIGAPKRKESNVKELESFN